MPHCGHIAWITWKVASQQPDPLSTATDYSPTIAGISCRFISNFLSDFSWFIETLAGCAVDKHTLNPMLVCAFPFDIVSKQRRKAKALLREIISRKKIVKSRLPLCKYRRRKSEKKNFRNSLVLRNLFICSTQSQSSAFYAISTTVSPIESASSRESLIKRCDVGLEERFHRILINILDILVRAVAMMFDVF